MTDIVHDLRDIGLGPWYGDHTRRVAHAAADEIDRLRADRDSLQALIDAYAEAHRRSDTSPRMQDCINTHLTILAAARPPQEVLF